MIRVRIMLVVALVLAASAMLGAVAQAAHAQKLYGCGSKLNWPCPGPAL